MKFNSATLYKVPFDNSYSNVVDYHEYSKTGTVLTKLALSASGIKLGREVYFQSLPQFSIYSDSAYKSVKIINDSFECSIVGEYEDICEYNYIVFRDIVNNAVVKEFYCFITRFVSNNDSTNPSCTIIGRIDYWTNYIDTIMLNTPEQFVEYSHDNPKVYNGKKDSRLPSDFIMKNEIDYMLDDVILFLVIDRDLEHPGVPALTSIQRHFDTASMTYARLYIPMIACSMENHSLVFRPIVGTYKDENTIRDASDIISKGGWFAGLESQYTFGASLSFMTPFGVMKASDYTVKVSNKVYFKASFQYVDTFEYDISASQAIYGYNGLNVGFEAFSPPILYATNRNTVIPVNNTQTQVTYTSSLTYQRNVLASYNSDNEIKLLQFPFKKMTFEYKGRRYNITPEPTGTTDTPSSTITFIRFNSVCMKISNTNNIANTITFSLNDNDQLPTSSDKYTSYKETAMRGDAINTAVKTYAGIAVAAVLLGTTIATGGAAAPATVPGMAGAITGMTAAVGTGAASIASFCTNLDKLNNMPDSVNTPSNQSIDLLASVFPRVTYSTLKDEDKNMIVTMWKKYGYPVFELRQFTMFRYWYDYKKIKNAKLPNITNPIARETIESILSDGVTIWHANRNGLTGKSVTIGDYSKNNPLNTDCTEVVS